jgi:parallel beta-helix repeat protein
LFVLQRRLFNYSSMNRVILLINTFLLFAVNTFSQTEFSGTITANATWTKANSPYIITDNVLVSQNVSLTIQPGVEVRFNDGKFMRVEGEIKAVGTQTDSIVFTSSKAVRGSWENIWLKGTISNYSNTYSYSSGSIFSYCRFSNAKEGLRLDDAAIQVTNSVFYNNINGINFKKTSQSLIYRSVFKYNTKGTSTSAGTENNGVGIFTFCNIIENKFEYNSQEGFSFGGYRNNSNNHQIKNNISQFNGGVGFDFQWGDVVTGFSSNNIEGNIIYKNGNSGMIICRDQNIIRNNIISENKGDGIGISGTYIYTGLTIENNIINNNGGRAVNLSEHNNTTFRFNQIINSGKAKDFPALQISNSYISSTNNNIVSNTFAFSKANDINLHYGPNTVTGNNFFGVKDSLFIRLTGKGSYTINATGNYWASLTGSQLSSRFFERANDFDYGTVNYSQSATTPNITAPISPVQNVIKKLVNNRVVLEWTPNIESDISGYKVYYGGYTGYSYGNVIDVGNVNTSTLPAGISLDEEVSVTAYDLGKDGINDQMDGNESWYSTANKVPNVPLNYAIDSSARRVRLSWARVDNSTNYIVYRSTDGSNYAKIGSSVSTVFLDSNLVAGSRYFYKIASFDSIDLSYNNYGLESPLTEAKSATPSNILYVDPAAGLNSNIGSKSSPYLSIQSAINTAQNGDTVILARGNYFEAIDLKGKIALLTSNYYLTGDTADIHQTVLSGKNNGNVNLISNTINCANATRDININGITLTDARLQAINLQTINCSTSIRLTRSIVKNSGSFSQWGVVGIGMNGTIDSCSVYDNKGRYIVSTNANGNGTAPVIRNSKFFNNSSSADATVFNEASTIHVEGKYHVINNLVYKNRTTGIDFGGNGSDSAVFINNTLVLNTGYGIRFQTWGGTYNGFLINNISSFNKQSDISANTVTAGPGYYLRNNFFGKNGFMLETNLLSVNNTLLDTAGNIGGDPFFRDTLNNDFRLHPFSPAIGAGATSNYLLSKDIAGNLRINPWRQVPDIGAFESIHKFPAPILLKSEPGNKQVTLFWTQKNSGTIKAYKIYRSTNSIPDTFSSAEIATVNSGNIFTYVDSSADVVNNTKYYYRLRAVHTDNSESGLGKSVHAVPNSIAAPQNLRVDNSPQVSRITWNTVSGSNIKFQLFRDTDSTRFTLLRDSISAISFLDSNFARNTIYYYRLRTIDSAGALSIFTSAIASRPNNNWYVDSAKGHDSQNIGSVSSPLRSISLAVSHSITGDSIFVGPGTYVDNILYKNKVLSFIGVNGADKTIVKPLLESSIFYFDEVGSAYMKDFTLMNGSSRVAGSAILERLTNLTIENIIFRNNGSSGGIISTQSGTITMNNCLAFKNTTNTFFELSNSVSSPLQVNNFTYYENSGLLFNSGNPNYRARFKNSIFWNKTPINYSGVIEVDNSIFKGGFPTGRNVIDAYPQFADTSNSNFRLLNYSPALGLGDTAFGIRRDFDGNRRPNPLGYLSDAGSYESKFDHASPLIIADTSRLGIVNFRWLQYPAYSVDKIYIYKGLDSALLTKYDSATVSTNYRDTGNMIFNKLIFYSTTSIGKGLNESGIGQIIRTIAFTPPELIDNILGPQDSIVTLRWSKIKNALKYNIQISQDSNFINAATISRSDTSYLQNQLLTNTIYYWRVQTLDSTHTSRWSPFKKFKTRLKAPILSRIIAGNKVDTLFWSANNNINIKKYYIYRDTVANPTIKLDSVAGSVLTYVDKLGLQLNIKYYYRVAAVDSSDSPGPFSNIMDAQPFNRKPNPIKLENKDFPNTGNFNTVRTVYSSLGSFDPDGRIIKYKWYVNDSLINDKDSVFIHYYKQGLNQLKLVVVDNDSSEAESTASISISSFVKVFSGGFLGGIAALDNNNLFIADSTYDPIRGASVYKVDKNGNTAFPLIVTSKIFTTPSVSSDSSLFITNGSSINGFNFSGAPLWPTISLGGLTYVTPTIDSLQSKLYIGVSNSNFFAIDYKTGKVSWNLICDAAINSSAVITGDRRLVFVSNNGTLYGFDLAGTISMANPIPKWRKTFAAKPSTSPAVDTSNNIYFGTANGKLMKIKLLPNGNINEVWYTDLDTSVQASPIIDGNGNIYVGTQSGQFYKINATDGTILWRYKVNGAIKSTPTISDFRSIYLADMTGSVTSLSTDGKLLWKYKVPAPISANILYINNTVYIGTEAGRFIGIYDNPATNSVNTSLSAIDHKYTFRTSGLAHFRSADKLMLAVEKIYDEMVGPPMPSALDVIEPVWGTFQGNAKRTGSRRIECPDIPSFFKPTCTIYSDSIILSTRNMQSKYWMVNQNVLKNYTDTIIQVKSTDNVKLMAYNEFGCNVFAEKPVFLTTTNLDKPKIQTSSGSFTFCNTDSIVLSTSIIGDRYQWSYMNLPISGATNRILATSNAGGYSVTVLNKAGCVMTSDLILVNSLLSPSRPSAVDRSSCLGETTSSLTAQSSIGHTLRWYGTNATGGTASLTAPIPSSANTGSTRFYVTQVGSNGCESERAGLLFTVHPKPEIPGVTTILACEGETPIVLSATANSGHSLRWYGTSSTGGAFSNTAPIHSTSKAGLTNYYVVQVSTVNCESDRAKLTVIVNSKPAVPIVNNLSVCTGSTVPSLSATALTGHTLNWFGTNQTGGTASITAPVASSVNSGQNTYYVSQTSANGCESERASLAVTVHPKPFVPQVTNLSVCVGAIAPLLTAVSSPGHVLKWYGNNATGGIATGTPSVLSTSVAGLSNYYVSQVNLAGCESDRAQIIYTVNANPAKPVVTWTGLQLTTSTGFTTYQWLNNNTAIMNATANVYQPINPGIYQVVVSNAAGCTETSAAFNLVVTSITNSTINGFNLKVYPNPTTDKIVVDLGHAPQKTVIFRLYQRDGKQIREWQSKQRNTVMPVHQLPSGNYILKLSSGKNLSTISIIKY